MNGGREREKRVEKECNKRTVQRERRGGERERDKGEGCERGAVRI